MQTDTIPGRDRDLLNRAYATGLRLGRPFEPADVAADHTGTLAQAAHNYAATYRGDFRLVRDFSAQVQRGKFLTCGQAKVVLNTMMGDARRALAARKPAPAPVEQVAEAVDYARIPKGRFTVVFDVERPDDRLTVEVVPWDDFTDRKTGEVRDDVRAFRYLAGSDNTADYMFAAAIDDRSIVIRGKSFGPRQQKALAILAAASAGDFGKMGAAYSFESSRCWRCNRLLTVEDSVAGGIGETCAKKVGAAYGGEIVDEARAAMARLEAARSAAPESEPVVPPPAAPAPVAPVAPATLPSYPTRPYTPGNPRTYEEIFGPDDAVVAA